MVDITVTTTDGEQHTISRTGPIPDGVNPVEFIDRRTPDTYTVESVEVHDPDADLAAAIEKADSLEELKAALLGEAGNGKAKARGRRP